MNQNTQLFTSKQRLQTFLWWLSTAEPELLQHCVIDRNRYAIIGSTVLGTWIFATLAWTYFFSITVTNIWMAICLGLLMGSIVLSIDRALIKSVQANNKKKLLPFVFRGILAFTIGSFMAQPALLYLFDKEINTQIAIDNETRKKEKQQLQTSFFAAEKNYWTQTKLKLQKQLNDSYQEVATARNAFIAETDGTGGSGKIGLKAIALTKKRAYEQLDSNHQLLQTQLQPQMQQADSAILSINNQQQNEQQQFNQLLNTGFLTRIEALNNLTEKHTALQWRYYLILAILLLIELMPLIAKYLLPEGSYDLAVRLLEANEKTLTEANMQRILLEKEQLNQILHKQNLTYFEKFTSIGNQKMNNWQTQNEQDLNKPSNNELLNNYQKEVVYEQKW